MTLDEAISLYSSTSTESYDYNDNLQICNWLKELKNRRAADNINKYSKEEIIETFTDQQENKLNLLYASDWLNLKSFADLVYSDDIIKGIGNFVNSIDVHCDSWLDLNNLSEDSKNDYFKWLFRSTLKCIDPKDRIEGKKIRNSLPITLEVNINESFKTMLNNLSDETGAINEFNRVRDEVILPELSNKWKSLGFNCRVTDAVTTEDKFNSFRIEISQLRTMSKYESVMTNQEYIDKKFN